MEGDAQLREERGELLGVLLPEDQDGLTEPLDAGPVDQAGVAVPFLPAPDFHGDLPAEHEAVDEGRLGPSAVVDVEGDQDTAKRGHVLADVLLVGFHGLVYEYTKLQGFPGVGESPAWRGFSPWQGGVGLLGRA